MASNKPSWRDVKQVIRDHERDQLIRLIQGLYRLNSSNADFLHARVLAGVGAAASLDSYKTRIRKAICPDQPWKQEVKLRDGRKAISDFRKASGDVRSVIELMAYYLQCGNDFTLDFGDIDGAFYDSLCSMLDQMVKLMLSENDPALASEFIPVLEKEFARIDGQMGWGYPDEFGEQVALLRSHFG